MANMNVTYEAMSQEARALGTAKTEIEGELTRLENRIQALVNEGFVTDSASGAFEQMYLEFSRGAKTTIDSLDGIATTLEKIAHTLQETDRQLAQGIG